MPEPIAHTERIHELSDISKDVANMLKAAGLAIRSLTGKPSSAAEDEDDEKMIEDTPVTLESQKTAFESNVTTYYNTLQAITARLRRQVYALEEAGIISSESAALGNARNTSSTDQGRIMNGGLGNLDVGWLNSRTNRVGAEKEQEILSEVKEVLQDQLEKGG